MAEAKNYVKYVGIARIDEGSHVIIANLCTDMNDVEYENYLHKILRQDSKLEEGKLLRIPASREKYDFLVKVPRPDDEFTMKLAVVGVVDRLMAKQKCTALCKAIQVGYEANIKPRQIHLAEEKTLNSSCKRFFQQAIKTHGSDKMQAVSAQLENVKGQMKDNLLAAMQRGDDLDDIEHNARDLDEDAQTFNRTAVALKRYMCCKNIKMTIMLTCFLLVVIGVIVVIAVCTQGDTCESKSGDGGGGGNGDSGNSGGSGGGSGSSP